MTRLKISSDDPVLDPELDVAERLAGGKLGDEARRGRRRGRAALAAFGLDVTTGTRAGRHGQALFACAGGPGALDALEQ
jgi:hypothetical protein